MLSPSDNCLQEYKNKTIGEIESLSQRQLQDPEKIFDESMKQMKKYDAILAEIQSSIDLINHGDFITDFYPGFVSEAYPIQDDEKGLIEEANISFSKIKNTLQQSNNELRNDIKGWVFEFAKKTKLTEVLISQNKLLRASIMTKNTEIVKMIQAISKAQNAQIVDLQDQLQVLQQENGVLMDHLREVQAQILDSKDSLKKLQLALEKGKLQHLTVKNCRVETADEEEHFQKMCTLLEGSIGEQNKRTNKLEREREQLMYLQNSYLTDDQKLSVELQLGETDKRTLASTLKKAFKEHQTQKDQLIAQIQDLSQAIQLQKQRTRYWETEASRNLQKIEHFTRLNVDFEKTLAQQESLIVSLKIDLSREQQQEAQRQLQLKLAQFDSDILKEELQELNQKQQQQQERRKKQLKSLEEMKSKEWSSLQSRSNQQQRDVAIKALKDKSDASNNQIQLEKLHRKILLKKEELEEIKAAVNQIKDNQIRVIDLRSRLNKFPSKDR